MTTNRLVEIPSNDWEKLAEFYRKNKITPSGWNCIQNYITWLKKDPSLDVVKIYSLNGDWSDGTFIIQDDISIMFNTLHPDHTRLLDALNCIDDLPQPPKSAATYTCLCDFAHRFKSTIETYMKPTGVEVDTTAIWLHLPREKALSFNVDAPEGTTLKQLSQIHVEVVNNFWAYRYPGSDEFIGRLIRLNVSFGLFDAKGELLAWCLQLPRGSLGLLQVRDEHRRKGYGSLIVRAMARRLAQIGTEVTTSVVDVNVASRKMFAKLEFKEVDTIHWVCRPMAKWKS